MKNLVFAALIMAGASQTTGCIIDSNSGDGRLFLTWTLVSGSSAISCSEAGADGVRTESINIDDGRLFRDVKECSQGSGTTGRIPEGDYDVTVSLLPTGAPADTDETLGDSTTKVVPVFAGETTDIGEYIFDLPPATATIDFSIDYDELGGLSNCDDVDGLGVDFQETVLTLAGQDICVPLFIGNVEETPDVCTVPPACQESNIVQTFFDIPTGSYELLIEGDLITQGGGNAVCFGGIVSFNVTADDDLGTLVIPFTNTSDPSFCNTLPPE